MSDLPPWMIAENFGANTGTPSGVEPMPPGFPAGLWIDVTPPAAPSSPAPPSPSPSEPPPSSSPPPADFPELEVGPQSPYDPPAGDLGDLIRLGDAPEPGVPNLPPGGLESWNYEDGSSNIRRPGARFPEWSYDPFEGFNERLPGPWIGQWQPTEPTRPRVEIPLPGEDPFNAPGPADGSERARRRQGARERDAIIRDAAKRARVDTTVRRGRGVLEGVVRRAAPRIAGRIFGPIIGAIFPEELGSGEPSVEDMARREAEAIERQIDQLEQRTREVYDPYRGRQLGPEIAPLPSPAPPVISAPWPTTSPMPSPSPAPPQPSTAPQPRPTSTTVPSPAAQPFGLPWLIPLVGGALLSRARSGGMPRLNLDPAANAIPSGGGGVQPTVDPLTPPRPAPGTDPLTPPRGNPLTSFDAAPLGWSPPTQTRPRTRTRECECKPKKRKKARECTTRGNLVWSSGPKKGRPAGSRCVNFKGKK